MCAEWVYDNSSELENLYVYQIYFYTFNNVIFNIVYISGMHCIAIVSLNEMQTSIYYNVFLLHFPPVVAWTIKQFTSYENKHLQEGVKYVIHKCKHETH